MLVSEVLKLIEAGYTKDEINAFNAPKVEDPVVVDPTPAQKVEPEEKKAPEAVQDPVKPGADNIVISADQFGALLQAVKAGTANIDVPPTVNINDVLANHYQSILKGED